ncbi:hypothetical protein [Leyella stercorea]|uniref:hypothetical protein n=1 Tax=Leyella stercorea TaxID=363265 RepID=UPI0026734F4C|nr:hypothetical protein [Leyella stercorea]
MKRLPTLLTAALLLLTTANAKAQVSVHIDSLLFENSHRIDSASCGELRLNFDALCFFRDNEYKGCLSKGYTLPGYRLQPTVSYQPLKNLRVEVGVSMLHYWGANKYPNLNYSDISTWKGDQTQTGFHLLPFFNVQLAVSRNFNLILGNIYGGANHRLIEPLYNQENALSADPEMGVQMQWQTKPLDFDVWVNWESFIFDKDTHQEAFTFGLSTRFKANRPERRTHVYFPLQVVMQHRGGEINPDAEQRQVKTWMNAAAGVGVTIHTDNSILTRLNAEADVAYYRQMTGALLPFDNGKGLYLKAEADIWRFCLRGTYWDSSKFISIFGNPLYGSVGIHNRDFQMQRNRTVSVQLSYAQELGKGFSWGVQADVFNTLPTDDFVVGDKVYNNNNKVSLAAGIYLRVKPSFLLKKF